MEYKDETIVVDNAFSDELNIKLNEFMQNQPWYFGRKPHPDAPFSFWGSTFYLWAAPNRVCPGLRMTLVYKMLKVG